MAIPTGAIILASLEIINRAIPLIEELMDDNHPRESITKDDMQSTKTRHEAAIKQLDELAEEEYE